MPIPQSRMIRLLEAAETYRERYNKLLNDLIRICNYATDETAVQALQQIRLLAQTSTRYDPADTTIREEQWKNNPQTIKDNAHRAQHMREIRAAQRAAAGLPPVRSRATTGYETSREMEAIAPDDSDIIQLGDPKPLSPEDDPTQVDPKMPEQFKEQLEEYLRKGKS